MSGINKTVYIVDDCRSIMDVCRDILIQDLGYRPEDIRECGNEADFFKVYERGGMVIVDDSLPGAMCMHGVNGSSVVRYVRETVGDHEAPIIVLTDPETGREYKEATILEKPPSLDRFLEAVSGPRA